MKKQYESTGESDFMQIRQSFAYSAILSILFPGLGHIYRRDYSFGLFVFLVMLIGSLLFFVSLVVSLSSILFGVLLSLPIIFYLFSFVDLSKSIKQHKNEQQRSTKVSMVFLTVALSFQIFSPIAPLNFGIRNAPSVFFLADNRLEPRLHKGDLVWTNTLSYSVKVFFLEHSILHSLPEYGDVVSYEGENTGRNLGIVIGVAGEEIEIVNGITFVNGSPLYSTNSSQMRISGDQELTLVPDGSILIASLSLGRIESTEVVPISSLVGRVNLVF